MLFIGQSIGNVVGPLLYTQADAPSYSRGLRSNLALYIAIMVLVVVTTAHLKMLNKNHAKRRVAMGKSAVIIDTSLDSPEEIAAAATTTAQQSQQNDGQNARNAEEGDASASPGDDVERPGDRAFENLTDLQNEEFVFVF